jgi:hypothetical protein
VVGLVGRDDLQAQLMCWRESGERLGVVLMSGGGGFGKTRLALEECARANRAGWTAGLLSFDASADADDALDRLVAWEGRLFVVIDYAETRPNIVAALILRLSRRLSGPPVRLILVCRQARARPDLENLFATGDGRDEILEVLDAAEPVRLDEQELDRRRLFEDAVVAFAERLGVDEAPKQRPKLVEEHFARPLFVLAAALLLARDPSIDIDSMSRDQLMLELIDRHETQYWQRWNQSLKAGLDTPTQRRTAAAATMLGADTEDEAIALVAAVPALGDASVERRRVIAGWLSHLYGGGRLEERPAIWPVEPDMLGEALIKREYENSATLLADTFAVASSRQLARALSVLARACTDEDKLTNHLREVLDQQLPMLVSRAAGDEELAAGIEAAANLAVPRAGAVATLEANEFAADLGHLDLTLTRLAIERFEDLAETDPARHLPGLARAQNRLGATLNSQGRVEEALVPSENAVESSRAAVEIDRGTHLLALGATLNDLAAVHGTLRKDKDALAAIEEAVGIWRGLARDDDDIYRDLTPALNNLSITLSRVGRVDEALDAGEEAVLYARQATEADHDRYLPDLATALNNFSNLLEDVGKHAESLVASEESTELRRNLAQEDPERYEADLASALNNLANRIDDPDRAVQAAREAVELYGRSAERNPDRYLPELAIGLNTLAIALSNRGDHQEALTSCEKSMTHYRGLAAVNPTRYLPDLAAGLNSLAVALGQVDRPQEGLVAEKESVHLYRGLAKENSHIYLPYLASALNNLGNLLVGVERTVEAVGVVEEAVEIRRRLVAENPARFKPDLAGGLYNLSIRLRRVHRLDDSLLTIEESVHLWRELSEQDRDRYLPSLAASLNGLALVLARLDQGEQALEGAEEAAACYRELREQDADRYEPDLAAALNTLANRLRQAGRLEEALTTIEESIALRRALVSRGPPGHLSSLVTSLGALSACLTQLGRPGDALAEIKRTLDENAESPVVPHLLMAQANHHRSNDEVPMAIRTAWKAAEMLGHDPSDALRGRARSFLRSLRRSAPDEFDRAWDAEVGIDQPIWLQRPATDNSLAELLLAWIKTADWNESKAFLSENSDALLGDAAEAGLEHLIDHNPGRSELVSHLKIARRARVDGIAAPYAEIEEMLAQVQRRELLSEWITRVDAREAQQFLEEHADVLFEESCEDDLLRVVAENPGRPGLLALAALLGLARSETPAGAYERLNDELTSPDEAECMKGEWKTLLLTRLGAGLDSEDAELQFRHALAAGAAGHEEEAELAIERCRLLLPTWERQHYLQRLTSLTETDASNSDRLAKLRSGLIGPSPDLAVP